MMGVVDDQLRALLPIAIAPTRTGPRFTFQAWIDTAFNGGLVLPRKLIHALQLEREATAEAILADGKCVTLELYACFVDWFGGTYELQVIANESELPLLGTQLLVGRKLIIDYSRGLV
jgi:clan AA aspartic protease